MIDSRLFSDHRRHFLLLSAILFSLWGLSLLTFSAHSTSLLNTPPVANNDRYLTQRNTTLDISSAVYGVLGNDTDADGDSLTMITETVPSNGTFSLPSITRQVLDCCSVGDDNDMILVNGNPAISYLDKGDDDIYYMRALDIDGTAWTTPTLIADVWITNGFADTNLIIVNGFPAITYFDH